MPFVLSPIITKRLCLFPATAKLYLLELHDRPVFASTIGAHVPEEWPPDQITSEVIEDFVGRIHARERKIWSFYWLLRRKVPENPVLIGHGGFLAHRNGTLEIGYSLLTNYQGRGYATEAVRSMVQWASSSLKRDSIIAYTYPHLKASIRVLEKNGFVLKGNSGEGPEEKIITYELLSGNEKSISGSLEFRPEKFLQEII